MKNFIKNYAMSLVLLSSIIVGGILGLVLGPDAKVLEPFGQIFLNLIFTLIVPLVFFSVTSSIANMGGMGRLGKIMLSIVLVFAATAILSALLSMASVYIINPTKGMNEQALENILQASEEDISEDAKKLSLPMQLVKTVTVGDFSELFTKSNMLQLIVISIICGIAIAMAKERANIVKDFINACSVIMMNMIKIIMYYAPFGLACYFASMIGQLGRQILEGYLKVFLLYLALTIIYYFLFFTIYAYVAGGKQGIKAYWKNAIAPAVTALATCSSAASIPVNLEAAKKIGIPNDIAETVIPLGVNTHKDGSVIGGVLKIVFLFGLFGKDFNNLPMFFSILAVSLLVGAVMGAIPGGGMIGEMLILSVYGFPPAALPVIVVIGTIIDAPATLLNSSGNTVCAMLVARFVDGKDWLKAKNKS
ncbi:dicarboxylate/amino acid:cation symporter [Herbinix luporum]|jgi:Na+/H+-dicarboxylate symporter|uniref:Putative membrane protein n=1 Tax=Herbinix luporum TaxID=1679721 RepID=A0A0K8J5H4_9FIRM|nr:dicarboxylate/amino acid:cation symporter [Herbinix luporum]CUH92715.1 putative membrane protein [Herbinix luporum]HHT56120.1 dicarboxylate/amino acid:cation symporter [Herbinix luporum]